MCCDPAAQHQAPAPTPSRLWGWKEGGKGGRGGGVGATPSSRPPLHTSPISTPTPNPATSRINRSATPYKRCGGVHASAGGAPPTMIGLLERRGGGGKYRTLKKQTKTKQFLDFNNYWNCESKKSDKVTSNIYHFYTSRAQRQRLRSSRLPAAAKGNVSCAS